MNTGQPSAGERAAYDQEFARLLDVHAEHRQRLMVCVWADWGHFFRRYGEPEKALVYEARIRHAARMAQARRVVRQ